MLVFRTAGLLALLTMVACAEPLEFPDWTVPVADGTVTHDFAGVPVDDRDERIELVEELVLGAGATEDGFYRPADVAVADDGRMYVLDAGNHRIQAFDAAGGFLRTISREGQGPGEIRSGGEITVAGDTLVRAGDGKVSVWTLDGEHVSDAAASFARSVDAIAGLADGAIVARYEERNEDGSLTNVFARISPAGQPTADFARLTGPDRTTTLMSEQGLSIVRIPSPAPAAAVWRSGDIYLTNADEYQVLALDSAGGVRWALRTTWLRLPLTDEDKSRAVLRYPSGIDPDDLDVAWPPANPALANGGRGASALHVDGHGHLYVFPFIRDPEAILRPVDVYAADGEHLFAGLIEATGWLDARGDLIYRLQTLPESEERVLTVHRLVEPF